MKYGGIFKSWPHCYRNKTLQNNLVIRKNGKITGHTGCIPLNLIVDKHEIPIAGISGVSTAPELRGHGIMGTLLNYCSEKMEHDNIAFSFLGGDRQRYNRYGWENAGRQWVFTITNRSLITLKNFNKNKIVNFKVSDSGINRINEINNTEYSYIQRTHEYSKILFNRTGIETLCYIDNNKILAYAVVPGLDFKSGTKNCSISEFGSINNDTDVFLLHIIEYLLKVRAYETVTIYTPYYHRTNKTLLNNSASWQLSYRCMFKIINLKLLLNGFLHQIRNKYLRSGIKTGSDITLQVQNTQQQITLCFTKTNVYLTDKPAPTKFVFTDLEIPVFLFGPVLPSGIINPGKLSVLLNTVFPLDFYISHHNGV